MTEMQKMMYAAVGHLVEVYFVDSEKPLVGKCVDFTSPQDNDPEIAAIDLRIEGRGICELSEEEIEKIVITDKKG